MASVEVRDVRGAVRGERELPAALFQRAVNVPLMHQVVVAGQAAQRAGTHSTKTRGEVAGGGTKPWRQKGTGRARHGSIRSPIWTGGGIAHGPKPRDHSVRVNKKMKRAALRSALSDAAASGKLAVVEELVFDAPRTQDAAAALRALGLDGTILLVIERPDELVEKSFRNLPYVKIDYPGNLSTYDILYADRVLFTAAALDALAARDAGEERSEGTEPVGTSGKGAAGTRAVSEPEPAPAPAPGEVGAPGADSGRTGADEAEMPEEAGT